MKFSNGSFLRLGETLETMKNRDLRKYTSQAHDRFSAKEIAMEVSTRKLNLTWDTMLAEGTYQELWDMYRGDGEPGLADAMGMSEREFASAFRIAGEDIKAMIKNHIGSQRGVEEARSSASDQAAKAGAYNGGKSLAGNGDGNADLAHKLKGDALQKHRDASVAKMDAEDEAAKKAQRDRLNTEGDEALTLSFLSASLKNKMKPVKRNPVASHAQSSGSGTHQDQHNKNKPDRKQKHKKPIQADESIKSQLWAALNSK